MAEKIAAIKIGKATQVGLLEGGAKDVFPGDVLTVGKGCDISEEDARFLIAGDRAEECDRAEAKKKAK